MKHHFAATALALVLAMNIGSGWTPGIDRQMVKIESSLCDVVESRTSTEQMLEAQRKYKSRAQIGTRR